MTISRDQAKRLRSAVRDARSVDFPRFRRSAAIAVFLAAVSSAAAVIGLSLGAGAFPRAEENQMKLGAMATVVTAVSAMAVGGQAEAQAVQWRVEDGGNGHWYQGKAQVIGRDWNGWRAHAESVGAHLVTITSVAESAFVSSSAVWPFPTVSCNGGHAFIGLFQPPGSPEPMGGWQWVTGEPFVLDTNQWISLEDCCTDQLYCEGDGEDTATILAWPGQCGSGTELVGKWNDVGKCLDRWGAILEWSADCNNDGIVDFGQISHGELADTDANGIPDQCECRADLNGDGAVGASDLPQLLNSWGTTGASIADLDGDGFVGPSDLTALLTAWGSCGR